MLQDAFLCLIFGISQDFETGLYIAPVTYTHWRNVTSQVLLWFPVTSQTEYQVHNMTV